MMVEYKPPTAGHYIGALIFPIYGFIAGIVAMSRSMVGPGFALWGTAFAGCWLWPIVIVILAGIAGSASG